MAVNLFETAPGISQPCSLPLTRLTGPDESGPVTSVALPVLLCPPGRAKHSAPGRIQPVTNDGALIDL